MYFIIYKGNCLTLPVVRNFSGICIVPDYLSFSYLTQNILYDITIFWYKICNFFFTVTRSTIPLLYHECFNSNSFSLF